MRFADAGNGRTRVEFEHRNIERFGANAIEVFASLDGDDGWGGSLKLYADMVEGKEIVR